MNDTRKTILLVWSIFLVIDNVTSFLVPLPATNGDAIHRRIQHQEQQQTSTGKICVQTLFGDFQLNAISRNNNDIDNDEMSIEYSDDDLFDQDVVDDISDEELLANAGGHNGWDEKIARYNTIHLTGRIGSIQEPKYLNDGNKVVVSLSLATKRKYHFTERKANNLNYNDDPTDWYGLEVWGQTAEYVTKFVDIGTRVSVIGQLQIDNWTDKESGEVRYKAKVIVRDFDILESKNEADLRKRSMVSAPTTTSSSSSTWNNNNNNKKDNDQRGRSFFNYDDDEAELDIDVKSNRSRPAGSGGFFNT